MKVYLIYLHTHNLHILNERMFVQILLNVNRVDIRSIFYYHIFNSSLYHNITIRVHQRYISIEIKGVGFQYQCLMLKVKLIGIVKI